ncbi:MAG TPA: GNAT family N-acetyltransferase [Candidatus Binatia bacterium]|jgi:ribosomal protein S18 acetylase RimI-like enzyme|nr:GNAT family N-acetyltransferase [Candidatus Binatia bacterium]
MTDAASRKVVIRRGHPEEVTAILALWRKAETTVSVTDTVEDLGRAIAESPAVVLVAEVEGQVIGSVIGSFDGWRGNIYRLAIHPDYRRQGIARALVDEVERHLAHQGAKLITAWVEQEHPWAMGFWRAIGYEVDARMVRFMHGL